MQPVTRAATGKLPPNRPIADASPQTRTVVKAGATASPVLSTKQIVVGHNNSIEEIKAKYEEELRNQRAEHHKKRALEMNQNKGKCLAKFSLI